MAVMRKVKIGDKLSKSSISKGLEPNTIMITTEVVEVLSKSITSKMFSVVNIHNQKKQFIKNSKFWKHG